VEYDIKILIVLGGVFLPGFLKWVYPKKPGVRTLVLHGCGHTVLPKPSLVLAQTHMVFWYFRQMFN